MNLQDRIARPSDISEHLQTLHDLAASIPNCRVVEFGVRTGNSTCAFLTAGARVFSYDIETPRFQPAPEHENRWTFCQADTGRLDSVPTCDILFIDTLHTGGHVRNELRMAKHADKYIVFHDTILFGSYGELGQSGITGAIYDFLRDNPRWRVKAHYEYNNGLLILAM
jgi:tRNA A58 N-methylase Trm61